ncbi:MAG: hypothetical protein FWE57_03855 [Chitinispirillia bacterium]|nr:hypothetical protein [Chitinispirillia bacterium]
MAKKRLPDDFKDFIQCLNSNSVRYLLVGGWAVGMYGHPRATKDIDISVISRDDLIINKRASGRSMDIADAEKLEGQK